MKTLLLKGIEKLLRCFVYFASGNYNHRGPGEGTEIIEKEQ